MEGLLSTGPTPSSFLLHGFPPNQITRRRGMSYSLWLNFPRAKLLSISSWVNVWHQTASYFQNFTNKSPICIERTFSIYVIFVIKLSYLILIVILGRKVFIVIKVIWPRASESHHCLPCHYPHILHNGFTIRVNTILFWRAPHLHNWICLPIRSLACMMFYVHGWYFLRILKKEKDNAVKVTLRALLWNSSLARGTPIKSVCSFNNMNAVIIFIYFHQLGPSGPSWSVSCHVRVSVCVCLSRHPAPQGARLLVKVEGLSLALRSPDQIPASH